MPLSVASSGGMLSGRYGEAKPLQSSSKEIAAEGMRISRIRLTPEGNGMAQLTADIGIIPKNGTTIDFDQLTKQLNDPIVLVDGKPEAGTPYLFCQRVSSTSPCQMQTNGNLIAELITFVPAKDVATGSPLITVTFPFDGPNWKDSAPNYDPTFNGLKVTRLGSDKEARLLITSANPGDQLCVKPWVLQLQQGSEIPTTPVGSPITFPKPAPGTPDLRGSTLVCVNKAEQMLSLEISAKTLKPYHHFLLVNKPANSPWPPLVGDIPAANPPPPGPSLDKDQKVTVGHNNVRIITFTGKHLDQISQVLFDSKPVKVVKKEDKSIVLSLSRVETGKAPALVQLQLLSDGNDPVLAEFTVTCNTTCGNSSKKGQ